MNTFFNLTLKIIDEKIINSKYRIIYVSPGINANILISIRNTIERIGLENIHIIIDADTSVLRYGYGDEDSVKYMGDCKIQIKTQKGLRIGFFCVDGEGYIFSPTPFSIEDEKIGEEFPNAIRINGVELERIINGIVGEPNNENSKVEIGKENLQKKEIEKIKKEIEYKPIIKADVQRQINVINSKFQMVEIEFKGSELKNKTFKVDSTELGINDNEIARQISTSYRIFKNLNLPIEVEQLANEFKELKNEFLEKVDNVGLLLINDNCENFLKEVKQFEDKIKKVQKDLEKKIDFVIEKSKQKLIEFIVSNLLKLSAEEKERIISYDEPTKENLTIYVENKLSREFPNAYTLLDNIKLTVKIYNISSHLMKNEEFKYRIAKHFKKSFDEIACTEMAIGTQEQKSKFEI